MRDDFRQPGSVKARFEPWPWLVAGVLIAFVAVEIGLVTLAGRNFEGPDDPTYYKMGLAYDQQMAHRREGWRVEGLLPEHLMPGVPVRLQARVVDGSGQDVAGRLGAHNGRPATKTQDQQVALPGTWTPGPGWWNIAYELDGQPLDIVRVHVP